MYDNSMVGIYYYSIILRMFSKSTPPPYILAPHTSMHWLHVASYCTGIRTMHAGECLHGVGVWTKETV